MDFSKISHGYLINLAKFRRLKLAKFKKPGQKSVEKMQQKKGLTLIEFKAGLREKLQSAKTTFSDSLNKTFNFFFYTKRSPRVSGVF